MAIIIWMWGFIEEIYLVVFTRYNAQTMSCSYAIPSGFLISLVPTVTFLLTFALPLLLLLLMYFHIIIALKRSSQTHQKEKRRKPAKILSAARRKVVKILFVVFIAFVVFWTPCQITFFVLHFDTYLSNEMGLMIKKIIYIIPLANSVINPIIYCLIYRQFRKGVFYVLRGCPK